jgi:hemerythrin-like domain-containing protein
MTITQLIQNSPSKANELFSKLADTSDGAIKTREKLFSELKEELETLASLEEKHLFPLLRKHQETKDLVVDAINDNKEVRKLLADLDKTPKTDPEFAPKLGELRKIFQQHVRDEKKELLPAVRKALSAEEAQTVIEKIEAGRAEAESEKKDDAKERKAEAKSGNGAAEKPQPAEAKSKAAEAAQARQNDEGKPREAVASRKAEEATDNAAPAKRMLEAGA